MNPDTRQWIKSLIKDMSVRSIFLISEALRQQARNGTDFWRLKIKDSSGSLPAFVWDPLSQTIPAINTPCLAEITGLAENYMNHLQVRVTSIRFLSDAETRGIDLTPFVMMSAVPPKAMLEELETLCHRELTHRPWHDFAMKVLDDPEIRELLLTATAAKGIHHAWIGGLLEHTLSVAKLCMACCDLYPDLDRQTLLVGAIFHDIGKIWELTNGLTTLYTDEGQLLGHISIGLEKLTPFLQASDLEPELQLHFKHLILSHHGQLEFGSPKMPQTAESFVLHFMDNLDARVTQSHDLLKNIPAGQTGWSEYQATLKRPLFQPMRTPQENTPKNNSADF